MAPENTLVAFHNAVQLWGADMLEMDVQLTVLNSCGVEVAQLFNGTADAQVTNEIQFHSDLLPSGTYFYRLSTPSGSQTPLRFPTV